MVDMGGRKLQVSERTCMLFCIHSGTRVSDLTNTVHGLKLTPFKFSEILMVIDGPIDKELEALCEWAKSEVKVNILKLRENLGFAAALNYGLENTNCELIFRHDPDDVLVRERFNVQYNFMVSNPDIAVCGGLALVKCGSGMSVLTQPEHHCDIQQKFKSRNPMIHASVIFRREAVLQVGGYPNFRKAQDYALWGTLISKGYKLHNLQIPVVEARLDEEALSKRGFRYYQSEIAVLFYLHKINVVGTKYLLFQLLWRCVVRSVPTGLKLQLYNRKR